MRKPAKISIFAKILIACLVLQFLCLIVVAGGLMFGGTEKSQAAFEIGQFIKIDVKTGQIEGNIAKVKVSQNGAQALTDEQYRQKRIKELTGQTVDDSSKLNLAKPDKNLMEAMQTPPKLESELNKQVKAPLNLEIPPEIMENNGKFNLPKISGDGKIIPWKYYAKPAPDTKGKKLLSIVISNIGLNYEATRQAMQLDENITLAFSPYANNLASQIATARANGFEAWLSLPLQHENYPIHDYGELTLLNEFPLQSNIGQLQRLMNNTNGIVGMIALPDEKFSSSPEMPDIFKEITGRGLLLCLYSNIFTPSENADMLIHAQPHINGGNIPADLSQLFRSIEAQTTTDQHLIITISAMPSVLHALNSWIEQLPAKNIALTPLSTYSITND